MQLVYAEQTKNWHNRPWTTDAISSAPAAMSVIDGWFVTEFAGEPPLTTPRPTPIGRTPTPPTPVDGINGGLLPGWVVAGGGGGGPADGGGSASTCKHKQTRLCINHFQIISVTTYAGLAVLPQFIITRPAVFRGTQIFMQRHRICSLLRKNVKLPVFATFNVFWAPF